MMWRMIRLFFILFATVKKGIENRVCLYMEQKYLFEENPNPNAKIAFVVWNANDFYVYKDVYKHLPEAEIVVSDTFYSPIWQRGDEHITDLINLLKRHGVNWRVIRHLNLSDEKEKEIIENFFAKYEIIVALRLWTPLATAMFNSWLFKKKSVLMNYGAGKDIITFAPWVAHFNIVLSDGAREHHYFNLLSNSYIVGVPKYDNWFSQTIDSVKIEQIKNRLDPAKKTLLYLPTHSAFSSLYKFSDAVISLADKYNILIKLHYLNSITEENIVKKFKEHKKIFLFDEKDDLLPLFCLADAVLSDSSSASLEAILVDKPLVILDTQEDEKNMTEEKEYNGLWYSSGQVYSKSIEQQIKKPEMAVGEVVKNPEEVGVAVARSFGAEPRFKENRKRLRDELFSYNDGKCGERAAGVIRKYLHGEIKPEPPMLGMAIRSYFSSQAKEYQLKLRKKEKEIEWLKEIAAGRKKI